MTPVMASASAAPVVTAAPKPAVQKPKKPVVDPNDPSQVEQQIVQFLAGKQQEETARTALLALTTLAIALLLFGSKSK